MEANVLPGFLNNCFDPKANILEFIFKAIENVCEKIKLNENRSIVGNRRKANAAVPDREKWLGADKYFISRQFHERRSNLQDIDKISHVLLGLSGQQYICTWSVGRLHWQDHGLIVWSNAKN